MDKLELKTAAEIAIMAEGGRKLAKIKKALMAEIKIGKNAREIEVLADKLIAQEKGKASFKMVPGYHWATCINVNSGLVHGIPSKEVVFKKGDLVSVDLGIYYRGFHTDSSFSLGLEAREETKKFLDFGRQALARAIGKCRVGGQLYDLSTAIETTVKKGGYTPIKALVGHGVGRSLHQEPAIPCFVPGPREESIKLQEGMVLAIEVMYCQGKPDVVQEKDGWTISMADGKIAALFEETVAVTFHGPLVLTER
jgi:methionyl aminopeptidase